MRRERYSQEWYRRGKGVNKVIRRGGQKDEGMGAKEIERRGQAKTGGKGGNRRRGMHGWFNEPLCFSHSQKRANYASILPGRRRSGGLKKCPRPAKWQGE